MIKIASFLNIFIILTFCCLTLYRTFDPLSFDPLSFDPLSFDPLSFDPLSFDPVSFDLLSVLNKLEKIHSDMIFRDYTDPGAEFKGFESWLKFETRLKYDWFHLKLFLMFQDLNRSSTETGFGWI